jgi:hypothetical protein
MANPSSGESDADIIGEVRQMYHFPLMVHIREAHKRGVPATVKIGSYNIQYEPYQFSGGQSRRRSTHCARVSFQDLSGEFG